MYEANFRPTGPDSVSSEDERELRFLEETINALEENEELSEPDLTHALDLGVEGNWQAQYNLLEQMRKYKDPMITVPKEYWKMLDDDQAMYAHETWDNDTAIRGDIRKPYLGHEDDPRRVYKIAPHVQLVPRQTSKSGDKKHKFYGIFQVSEASLPLKIGKDIILVDEIKKNTNH